ncbi:MAG TPA: hypothetical protein VMX55_09970 [candidate division Zixibacteria bacterium]|nr:hypothetical protein [candidate division Zixibacteria bacterium]
MHSSIFLALNFSISLKEVKITSTDSSEITKCVDGLLFWKEYLGLFEIKTSDVIKNNSLNEVIGELLLLQEQLQIKNIFTLIFINTEVTTTELGMNITKFYGLVNNVILIGIEKIHVKR